MSRNTNKILSKEELDKLPEIPAKVINDLKSVFKSYHAVLAQFLKCIKDAIKAQIGESDKWLTLSPRSQEEVLARIFNRVREIMKVGEPDGSGMPLTTFNTYCTIIKRCMLFYCTIEDAKRHANYALKDAFQKALKKRGGTLEQRMTKTLEECRADPGWVGNPKPLPVPVGTAHISESGIEMPKPGLAESPQHLVKLGLQQILEWAKNDDVRDALRENDPQVKQVRTLLGELREIYEEMASKEVAEAA